jgi:hypothetical protein
MKMTFLKKQDSQNGQALLFVVVAMTIALTIGLNASLRTVTSLSRTTRTDTSSRALAAAEGGVERYLSLSVAELEQAIDVSQNCPVGNRINSGEYRGYCLIEFTPVSEILRSQAYVLVNRYRPLSYQFELEAGDVKEINLYDIGASPPTYYSSNTIELCWSPIAGNADLVYLSYNQGGVQARGGLNAVNSTSHIDDEGFIDADGATQPGYDNCKEVNIGNNIYGLRVRTVGGSSEIGIFATGTASLPLQGCSITSIGLVEQDQGVTASKEINVVRTLPYLRGAFDYALYADDSVSK